MSSFYGMSTMAPVWDLLRCETQARMKDIVDKEMYVAATFTMPKSTPATPAAVTMPTFPPCTPLEEFTPAMKPKPEPEHKPAAFWSAGYLRAAHSRMKPFIDAIAEEAREYCIKHRVEAIAFSGMSGAAAAYPVCYLTGLAPLNIRKDSDSTHSSTNVEGPDNRTVTRYIILDDLIDSGRTMRHIITKLDGKGLPPSACAGILLWHSPYSRGVGDEERFEYIGAEGRRTLIPTVYVSTPSYWA